MVGNALPQDFVFTDAIEKASEKNFRNETQTMSLSVKHTPSGQRPLLMKSTA